MMDLNFFNIVLQKGPYEGNIEMQDGLRNVLIDSCIQPIDVKEADMVETATGKPVLSVLIIKCLEMVPGSKDLFKVMHNMNEHDYEGLPTLM